MPSISLGQWFSICGWRLSDFAGAVIILRVGKYVSNITANDTFRRQVMSDIICRLIPIMKGKGIPKWCLFLLLLIITVGVQHPFAVASRSHQACLECLLKVFPLLV